MIIPSIDYILDEAAKNNQTIWQVVLHEEQEDSGLSAEAIRERVERVYDVMREAATNGISAELRSVSGLTGGDAARYYNHYRNHKNLLGSLCARAMSYALATSEYNAAMGVIVAAPTAGSAGVLPGVLIAAQEEYGFSDRDAINALITASGIGAVIAKRATISGAQGGCQAEMGSGCAMAAAALCEVMGGTARQCTHAAALALKNSLGLACDPVAGLVEVPCVKRNGIYAVMAIAAADMALAGVESFIPPDEVIDAMYQIGCNMPACIRETAEGGLAITPTAIRAKNRLF
ncbi:MAG: L-serine dehydratase, iron-sulfur-dependent subunit alpha [Clostridium sp. SCN 57-10]|nr:MAG: L-serine dehydratase, iron-sulfur-dependent subunit alpha [Clostridium sp. SCN 57-10]